MDLHINEHLLEAMRTQQSVTHKGIRYERILDYIFWYDSNGNLKQSVVLLQNRSSVRVLADEVEVADTESSLC